MTKTTITLAATALLALVVTFALVTGYAGWYHAVNTGVYVGAYGFELVGPDGPGFFHCDDVSCGSDL